jgi:hypothetical protein
MSKKGRGRVRQLLLLAMLEGQHRLWDVIMIADDAAGDER